MAVVKVKIFLGDIYNINHRGKDKFFNVREFLQVACPINNKFSFVLPVLKPAFFQHRPIVLFKRVL